ncbi:MAG: polyprenyl synthetase family protein [Acetatifactor sp.]|nr:polyprenyl synthetase family protein [Acetatifactor sp.]
MEQFEQLMKTKVAEIDSILETYLPAEEGLQKTVLEAMNYSVRVGGKRLRPLFMKEVFALYGGESKVIEPFMAAIEMIHTYSLVHDDLPAMDNDEYRRGKKTTHAVYGEAMGILAGDGLLNYAFETAFKAFAYCGGDFQKVVRALNVLAGKAGVYGMIGGQTADIEREDRPELGQEQLEFIHEHKTAALIEASLMVGAILAGASEEESRMLEECGHKIGIAFQIQDDILDVIGTQEELGKPIGSDEKNGKKTYVTLNGLEQSKADVEKLSNQALCYLQAKGEKSEFLQELVRMLINRRK